MTARITDGDVVPSPPSDPVIGPVAVALSGGAVAELLARHLPGCARGAARVERCHPRYAKYKPSRHCHVLYELALQDARTGRRLTTLGHLTVLRARRAERLWSRLAASGLAERAARLHPPVSAGSACHLPELGGVMQLFPLDVKLPGLVEASSASVMPAALADALGVPSTEARAASCSPELVRYKPCRRAVLRYRLGGRDAPVVYGKLRADGAGAAQLALGRELIERGVPTPVPLAHLSRLGMTVHGEVRGTRLADLRGDGSFDAWMESAAEALARLHATSIARLPAHSAECETADLRAAAETAAALLPWLRADVGRLAQRLSARLATVRPQANTVHGSFHDDQVLVGDEGAVLVDLDSAVLGHPLLDVGHFLSYLSAAGEAEARARFLEAYGRLRPAGPEALLFEAASLLRWSSLPFRQLEPGWPAAVERRLELALGRLTEYERSRALA
jgi:Ser/Thr protein kinase RdoA (MazF antagonist)